LILELGNKIGENGQVLDSDASSWKMVEIKDLGLLVNNLSYVESLKLFTYSDAVTYCDSLVSGGYLDFRLPTEQELDVILNIASTTEIERSYFINYFKDFHQWGGDQRSYRNIFYQSVAERKGSKYLYYRYDAYNIKSKLSETSAKAFCVRNW
jgi:hypothetical protein